MFNAEVHSIQDLIKAFPDEQSCINHLETLRWNNNVISPFDSESKVYNCKGNRYKCKNTGKYFNVKTASLFDNTKMELQKWFLAIWIVTSYKKSISSLQLSRYLNITQKSAWFMLQRIRNCFCLNDGLLDNEVVLDETYVGNIDYRQTSKKIKKDGDPKTAVVGMAERGDNVIAKAFPNTTNKILSKKLICNVKDGSKLYGNDYTSYRGMVRVYDHKDLEHSSHQYVNGRVHTNNIE